MWTANMIIGESKELSMITTEVEMTRSLRGRIVAAAAPVAVAKRSILCAGPDHRGWGGVFSRAVGRLCRTSGFRLG